MPDAGDNAVYLHYAIYSTDGVVVVAVFDPYVADHPPCNLWAKYPSGHSSPFVLQLSTMVFGCNKSQYFASQNLGFVQMFDMILTKNDKISCEM